MFVLTPVPRPTLGEVRTVIWQYEENECDLSPMSHRGEVRKRMARVIASRPLGIRMSIAGVSPNEACREMRTSMPRVLESRLAR